MEVPVGYSRGHLSRYAALCSTGRVEYTIAFPKEPTALCLPMNSGGGVRGQEVEKSVFQSAPEPTLMGFQVQPRSLGMFRGEQMSALGGTISLDDSGPTWKVANQTTLRLVDAAVVDVDRRLIARIGTIEPESAVDVAETVFASLKDDEAEKVAQEKAKQEESDKGEGAVKQPVAQQALSFEPFYERFLRYVTGRVEDGGEIRLIARVEWPDGTAPGRELTPAVDRQRGFGLVVVHLKYASTPDPASVHYDSVGREAKARQAERSPDGT